MRVAIIGKDSYIGDSLASCLTEYGQTVSIVDAIDGRWKAFDFAGIDAVICVAAIVHRKDITDYTVYHNINTLMPYEIAKTAKAAGVKQFVFLSTMAVFGQRKELTGNIITGTTPCQPVEFYGKSKYEAEKLLLAEAGEAFRVCIVRPANVYGKGCKGNYMVYFKKLARLLPIVPDAYSATKQGLIYIDNLCQLLYLIIKDAARGIYHAQDCPPVSTTELLVAISKSLGKKGKTSRLIGLPFRIVKISLVKKLFGGVAYAEDLAACDLGNWQVVEFREAIQRTFG